MSSSPAALLATFFLFLLHQLTSSASASVITTPSGRRIPASLLNPYLPPGSITSLSLSSLVFEADVAQHLILTSADGSHVLNVSQLAPHVERPPSTMAYIQGAEQPNFVSAPLVRHGNLHAFSFNSHSRSLVAAWGPGLHLVPLRIPGIFSTDTDNLLYLNVPTLTSSPEHAAPHSLHLIQPDSLTSTNSLTDNMPSLSSARQATSTSTPTPQTKSQAVLRPKDGHKFESEFPIFFDVAFTFDSTFCALYGGNATMATDALYAAAVLAHQMAFARVVSVRIAGVAVHCDPKTDPFTSPCKGTKMAPSQCAEAILRKFSINWRTKARLRADVAYLATGYTTSSSSSASGSSGKSTTSGQIVGAAYVGAACNKEHGFGWMYRAYPVIIAHEMAHSLGAPHDSKGGLMQSRLDLHAKSVLMSPRSRRHIQAYVETAAQNSCLATRNSLSKRGHLRYTSFLRISRNTKGEASDIAFAPYPKPGGYGARFFTVHVYRESVTRHQLFVSAGTLLRRPNIPEFPFVLDYEKKGMLVTHSLGVHRAGAGLAIRFRPSRNKKPRIIDAFVAYLVQPTLTMTTRQLAYKVGFQFIEDEPKNTATTPKNSAGRPKPAILPVKDNNFTSWSKEIVVPINIQSNYVVAIGACFAGNDLLIAYVKQIRRGNTVASYSFYVVGKNVQVSGEAALGWEGPHRISSWSTTDPVGDVSISALSSSSSSELVVSHTQQTRGVWVQRFSLMMKKGEWKKRPSDINYRPDPETFKLTGGVSFIKYNGSPKNVMTGILLQSRRFNSGTTYWVEVGDDLLGLAPPPPRRIATAGMITPFDICRLCYGPTAEEKKKTSIGRNEEKCRISFQACLDSRESYAMSKETAKQLVTMPQQPVRDLSKTPSLSYTSSSIFCTGFHTMYMVKRGPKCSSKSNPGDMWSVGVTEILNYEARRNSAANEQVSVTTESTYGPPSGREFFISLGLVGHTRESTAITIYIRSSKFLRWNIVRKTVQALRRRPDFSGLFKPNIQSVRRINGRTFKIVYNYKQRFQAEFFSSLAATTF